MNPPVNPQNPQDVPTPEQMPEEHQALVLLASEVVKLKSETEASLAALTSQIAELKSSMGDSQTRDDAHRKETDDFKQTLKNILNDKQV